MNFQKGKVIAVRVDGLVVQLENGPRQLIPNGLNVRQPPGRSVLVATDEKGRRQVVSGTR